MTEPTSAQSRPVAATMLTYSFRLRPEQDLKKELDAFVQQNHLAAGALITGVGSLTDVTLRLANQDGPSVWQGHFEIAGRYAVGERKPLTPVSI